MNHTSNPSTHDAEPDPRNEHLARLFEVAHAIDLDIGMDAAALGDAHWRTAIRRAGDDAAVG